MFDFEINDTCDDATKIRVIPGRVEVRAEDTSVTPAVTAWSEFKPKQARRLAKALKKAARQAEAAK